MRRRIVGSGSESAKKPPAMTVHEEKGVTEIEEDFLDDAGVKEVEEVKAQTQMPKTTREVMSFEDEREFIVDKKGETNWERRGMDRIVRSIFDGPELEEEHEELRKSLSFNERASSKTQGQIMDALDDAGENAQRAAELLAIAKAIYSEYEAHAAITEGALRERGHEQLQVLKSDGRYSGRFSGDDVKAMMAKMAADEWKDLESRKAEAKRTIDVLEALAANWLERQRNLRAMLTAMRGA